MVLYATREDVMSALESQPSARTAVLIDRALESASRAVEGLLHRKFYPYTGTRYFAYPDYSNGKTGTVYLDENEVISVDEVRSAGVAVPESNYFLEPVNDGPPYNRIEVNRAYLGAFISGNTSQRNVAVDGVFSGDEIVEIASGTTVEAMDASETGMDVSDVSGIGVGSLLRIDNERMIVTGKSWISTGQTLQADIAANKGAVSVQVTDGTAFHANETILLDSERMLVTDIAGNVLTVQRAVEGSVLAAHTGTTIYVPRTLTVERGVLGTTAATHTTSATVYVHQFPGIVRELTVAYAIQTYEGKKTGYTNPSGGTKDKRQASASLSGLEDEAYTRYGRKARMRSV